MVPNEGQRTSSPTPGVGISIGGGVKDSIVTQNQSGGTNIVGATPNPNAPVTTYFYNGERLVRTANTTDKQIAEKPTFDRLVQLHDAHDWAALEKECDDEIKKVPAWLTPFMLKGLALSNLGRVQEALPLFDHVAAESAGQSGTGDAKYPGWTQAAEIAKRLREQQGR